MEQQQPRRSSLSANSSPIGSTYVTEGGALGILQGRMRANSSSLYQISETGSGGDVEEPVACLVIPKGHHRGRRASLPVPAVSQSKCRTHMQGYRDLIHIILHYNNCKT